MSINTFTYADKLRETDQVQEGAAVVQLRNMTIHSLIVRKFLKSVISFNSHCYLIRIKLLISNFSYF